MSKFTDALKAGLKAAADGMGPGGYVIGGRQVQCVHCGDQAFSLRNVPAHDVGSFSAFAGYALVCQTCTRVELFSDMPQRL